MQLDISVSDKILKEQVGFYLETMVFDEYEADVLKEAKVPAKAALIKTVLEDEVFLAELNKKVSARLQEFVADELSDTFYDCKSPSTVRLIVTECSKLEKTVKAARKNKEQEEEDAAAMARTLKLLAANGYKITKG